jgi:hypothetical protein
MYKTTIFKYALLSISNSSDFMMGEVKVKPIQAKAREIAADEKLNWKDQKRGLVINHEVKKFTVAFRENFATLIISALGVVAALSWNDAIKTAIDILFPDKSNIMYKFYVAAVVTIISVIITYIFSRMKPSKQ